MSMNLTEEVQHLSDELPVVFIVMMRMAAFLILCLNGTVLFCLFIKKQNIPRIYTLQISLLCLTDTTAGAALLVVSFVDYDWFRTDIIRCCLLIGFFVSSQSIALYNVAAICINRFIIMLRVDKVDHHLTRAKVSAFSTAALTLGSTLCSLPFVIWKPRQEYIYNIGCSMEAVFREHFSSTMKTFFITFLLPLLVTNLLYGYLFFMLRYKLRRTHPDIHSLRSNDVSSTLKFRTQIPVKENNGRGESSNQILSPAAGPSNLQAGRRDNSKPTGILHMAKSNSSSQTNVGVTSFTRQTQVQQSSCNAVPSGSGSNTERTHQLKAFILLGFILLFLNICTWPGVIVLMMDSVIDSWSFSRGVKVPLFCTISFNSIVNPILYTLRIKELRIILYETLVCSYTR